MSKPKKSAIIFSKDKRDSARYYFRIKSLVRTALPNNIIGMLAAAQERSDCLVFGGRWALGTQGKHNHYIYDLHNREFVYKNIALFNSAVKIIWHINRAAHRARSDRLIYNLDQKYYRCLEDVKFFKSKISQSDSAKKELYLHRLSQARQRLADIKNEISKIY